MRPYVFLLPTFVSLFLGTCDRAKEVTPPPIFRERLGTGVESRNDLHPSESFNIVEYLYYYNGGGVAATDINGDGLADLYFANNQEGDRLYYNEGNWNFRDVSHLLGDKAAGWSTGVSVEDVNGDGLPDIYVCRVGGYKELRGRNRLFIQQADGNFIEAAEAYGLAFSGFNTQAYWFDYDLDGDKDVYLLRHSVHNDATYGEARTRVQADSLAGDKLLRNDGDGFTEVTAAMGVYSSKIGYGLSAAIADFDGNGWPDIYVCNDFSENDYLYLNEEGGGFRESVRERAGHTSNFSMGSDVADLDRDGRPDLISLDMRPGDEGILKSTASADAYNVYRIKRRAGYYDQLPRNNVQWNRGGGHFSEIAELTGLAATDWSWSVLAEDFDGDGAEEVFVANGIVRRPNDLDYLKFISSSLARSSSNLAVVSQMPEGLVPNQLFRRTDELAYAPVADVFPEASSSTGAAVADLDGDGDLDLVVNNVNASAQLFENVSAGAYLDGEGEGLVRRYCNQRGMMSQSEAQRPYAVAVGRPEVDYALTADTSSPKTVISRDRRSSFDRQPLQPFAGAGMGDSTIVLDLPDGRRVEAGMWRSIRIGERVGGGWRYEALPGTEGWWQSLSLIEEGDGYRIIAGNWGLNSALGQPSAGAPLRLYYTDIDGNGRRDPLITYVRGGREYTLADKDELAAQFPGWRRNNLSYADFAGRDFTANFPDLAGVAPRVVRTLAHLTVRPTDGGGWRVSELPRATQITPLHTAVATPVGLLLGGNFLDVLPRIGRQDAAALQLLTPGGEVDFIDLGGSRNRDRVTRIERLSDRRYRISLHTGDQFTLHFAASAKPPIERPD
jgi:hypothetical protein